MRDDKAFHALFLCKKIIALVIAIIGFWLSAANTYAQRTPAYRSELNVPYCEITGKQLTLNVFLPQDATNPVPAIVHIHGGWWYGGKSEAVPGDIGGWQVYTSNKLAIFSINYRLKQDGGFPQCIRDCRNAIRFIRKNAKRFNIDPERIDVSGDSAGGQIALMVAMVPEDFQDGGPTAGLEGVSARVSGAFSCIQVADFVEFWNNGGDSTIGKDESRSRLRLLFHGITPDTDEGKALYTKMSPIGWVRNDVPPLLICDGQKDPIVTGFEGVWLYEKLKADGADATYWMTPNGGHSFPDGAGFDEVLDNFIVHTLHPNL